MSSNTYPYVYFELSDPDEFLSFRGFPSKCLLNFRKTLDAIIQKDSFGKSFGFTQEFLNMNCIDMDYVVVDLGGDQSCSMDALISIGNYDGIRRKFSNHRWLMVELKLNSKVAKDDKDDLKKKIDGTLSCIFTGTVDPVKIFVYPDTCVAAKKGKFLTWKRGSNGNLYKNWKCCSTKDFEEFLLLRQNIPYKVINEADDILSTFPDISDIDGIDRQLKYWRSEADYYSLKGNRQEYEHILSVLAKYFEKLRETLGDSDDKELLSMELDWDFLEKFLPSENE